MVFYTNTVILLEPYGGTITEPGLPVIAYEQKALNFAIQMFSLYGGMEKLQNT